jgi:hypothetical protein
MFVEAHLPVPLALPVAVHRLGTLLHGKALDEAATLAVDKGNELAMRVGPTRGATMPTKAVMVRTLEPRRSVGSLVVPIRWEAIGRTGRWFPALDANLALTAVGDVTSLLSIVGRYDPPFGLVGRGLDRALLHRVADATMTSLLTSLVAELKSAAAARPPAVSASGTLSG